MRFRPEDDQIVVDLETFSCRPNAVIVSIGAVKFSLTEGLKEEFFVNLDPKTSFDLGLHVSPDTINWWKMQSKEAIESWSLNPVPVRDGMLSFLNFYGPDRNTPIWGNGSSFDVSILESTIHALEFPNLRNKAPWNYWDIYCMKTLTNILGHRLEKTGVNHNALHDAQAEAKLIIKMLQS